MLDRHGRRGWSPGGRIPGRDAHGQGRRTPGGRHGSEEHLRLGALEDAGDAGAVFSIFN